MPSFADSIAASLPAKLELPKQFREVLERMEAEGFAIHELDADAVGREGMRAMGVEDPGTEEASSLGFVTHDPDFLTYWMEGATDADRSRFAAIIGTGGDGSRAGLWLDDEGRQHFVHVGSGSGSVWAGVITDDPCEMLRLMAIGYSELAFPEVHGMTPAEAHAASGFDDPPLREPTRFRAIVSEVCGGFIPVRAVDIVRQTPSMMDERSDDPFWRWSTPKPG